MDGKLPFPCQRNVPTEGVGKRVAENQNKKEAGSAILVVLDLPDGTATKFAGRNGRENRTGRIRRRSGTEGARRTRKCRLPPARSGLLQKLSLGLEEAKRLDYRRAD